MEYQTLLTLFRCRKYGCFMDKGRIIHSKLKKLFQMTWPSQRKFAEASSVHPATVNEYFSKNKDLRISNFFNILSTLGIDLEIVIDEALKQSLGEDKKDDHRDLIDIGVLINGLDKKHRRELLLRAVNLHKLKNNNNLSELMDRVESKIVHPS